MDLHTFSVLETQPTAHSPPYTPDPYSSFLLEMYPPQLSSPHRPYPSLPGARLGDAGGNSHLNLNLNLKPELFLEKEQPSVERGFHTVNTLFHLKHRADSRASKVCSTRDLGIPSSNPHP